MGVEEARAIGYDEIRVSGFNLEYIKDLKVALDINEHIKLNLTAVLKESEDVNNVVNTKNIEVYYGNSRTAIFYGIVTNISVEVSDNVKKIEIEAKSMSYLLDIRKKSRSFQDKSMLINDLIATVLGEYGNVKYVSNIPNVAISELLVQFEETDWQFLKRVISKYNQGIFVYANSNEIKLSLGVPNQNKNITLSSLKYKVYKDIKEYDVFSKNHLKDANEVDYITYDVDTYNILNLGECINFMSNSFYVYKGLYEIRDGILENRYKLRIKPGLRQKTEFNTNIIGSSIDGKIIGVQGEVVQVHLEIDASQSTSTARWFKFSTMSASSDGSGWYCMPEIGDSVKVYFPSKDEDESFAISAVSGYTQGAGEAEDRMGDPDTKYLRTKNDKEVKLTPDGIKVSCNSGQADFNLSSDGTLSITSQNNVNITASESLKIVANKSFLISAKESTSIACDKGGKLVFNSSGEIEEWGANVNNN